MLGLVLVVDSTDRGRIEEVKDFLNMVIIDEVEEGKVMGNVAGSWYYGNKNEVPGAMSASEITNSLDVASLRQKKLSSCALSGDGLNVKDSSGY